SAYPYHDWNERITDQCYAPNAASRILDADGRIASITNNYSRISFNFGPTLLAWLADREPEVYAAILEADRQSQARFSGHGSAIAQAYNHMIMPLATRRDKRTQILWGLADFQRRFGRPSEGFWLPETAVDLETLELLAEQDVKYTILSPYQARRVRKIGGRAWRELREGIDPTMPYLARLRGGRSIALFFYDGPISRAVAFEGLLQSGEKFADRLMQGYSEDRDWTQLMHIATDGETYGHHHARGDMALAYALEHIETNGLARITNYGEFLERCPPTHEVEIHEQTAWSCAHGIERWWRDCGCNSGGRPGWDQAWRTPLREALDWLRDELAPAFEEKAGELLGDPWRARDEYVDIVLDRTAERREDFLVEHARRPLAPEEQVRAWKWLELQRHAMLMYTSCGWFFDELSGIETVQVIQYAGRAVQLARELLGDDHESRFVELLAKAKSNIPEHRDGARVYERFVRPAMVDLRKVGAHYAITSLFDGYGERDRIYCYGIEREDHRPLSAGAAQLAVGRARVTSEITRESALLAYGVVHFGDHNLAGGVRHFRGQEQFEAMAVELGEAFDRADLSLVIRLIDRHFEGATYSLKELFKDDQRRILERILGSTLANAEASYRQVYERHAPLMKFLGSVGMPQPPALLTATEFVLRGALRDLLAADTPDLVRFDALVREAHAYGIDLGAGGLGYALERALERLADRMHERPRELRLLEELDTIVGIARAMPFEVDLWKVENFYYDLSRRLLPSMRGLAEQGDAEATAWVARFEALGEKLLIGLPS
ncbi:MAG TPA: DUF3536 domain-containing protein, partial [Candidatus Limnocylindrales bacterium]|nr:DUF3536 domain-containing protein [Candidatus Limnocylindrales bacterium]